MWENKQCKSFRTYWSCNGCQCETSTYSYRSTYMNSMGSTNQNPQLYTQENQRERNTSMQIQKIIKPQGKKLKEQRTTETTRKQVTEWH